MGQSQSLPQQAGNQNSSVERLWAPPHMSAVCLRGGPAGNERLLRSFCPPPAAPHLLSLFLFSNDGPGKRDARERRYFSFCPLAQLDSTLEHFRCWRWLNMCATTGPLFYSVVQVHRWFCLTLVSPLPQEEEMKSGRSHRKLCYYVHIFSPLTALCLSALSEGRP